MASGLLDEFGRPMEDMTAASKPSGGILVDGQHVADTVQCVHCNAHFVMRKGSGVERGWCRNCNGMVCGRKCAKCVPFEKKLDQAEAAARRDGLLFRR